MAALSDYVTGTISLTNGEIEFTGSGTGWLLASFREGDTIIDITGATEFMGVIATIEANGAGTLTKAWEGPDLVNAAYRMRYQADGQRVTAQARNLIELLGNGNLQAVAGLAGSADQVIMFTGPGTMTTVPKTDLVSGVAYDVQVDALADRAAYNGQAEGFSVLVANVGDGRAAVYAKASAVSGDWTDPAYVTGPVGPAPVFTVDDTTTLGPGSAATFSLTPTVDGYEIDIGIPAGRGPKPLGNYNPAAAYVLDDAVLDNGSTWVLTASASTGNAPPTLPTTSNAYWQLLARKGTDGAGTGDVVGPASATANRVATFDGTTGKLIKDSGVLVASLIRSDAAQTITASEKGQVLANIGGFMGDYRNKIINGRFTVRNRPTLASVAPGPGQYFTDKWLCSNGTNQTCNISLLTSSPFVNAPGRPIGALQINFSVAPSTGYIDIVQRIEDVTVFDNEVVTATAHMFGSSDFNVILEMNYGSGGSASEYISATAVTQTGTRVDGLFNYPALSGKTVGAGSFVAVYFRFVNPRTTGNLLLQQASFVSGDATKDPNPFSARHVQHEIALCERYYQRYDSGLTLSSNISVANANKHLLPVSMRTVPTISQTTSSGTGGSWSAAGSTKLLSQNGVHSLDTATNLLRLDADL